MARWSLHHGDCLEWLRTLPSESVDSVVTDPPAGIAFMSKAWDHHKGGRAQWVAWLTDVMSECLRVLKPGGHALVWSLPRTEHWTACAIEDAGFEIRDGVYHLFAQGWPKSLDVSKAIDAAAGAEREIVGRKLNPDGTRVRVGGVGTPRNGVGKRPWMDDPDAIEAKALITAPATDDAKRWQGWGTALKPACERWVLARKPIAETVAENVLAHGVGALNIDGCRVSASNSDALGRWPSNVVLSHAETCGDECDAACPVRGLDEQSGVLRSGDSSTVRRSCGQDHAYGRKYKREQSYRGANEGGASRTSSRLRGSTLTNAR